MARASWFQRVKKKVKDWFSGGGSSKATPPRPRAVDTNRDARNQTVSSNINRRAFVSSLNGQKKEKEKDTSNNDAYKATKQTYKSMAEAVSKNKGLDKAINEKTDKYLKMQESVKKQPPKERKPLVEGNEAQKKAREQYLKHEKDVKEASSKERARQKALREAEHNEFHTRTNHKYDVKYWEEKGDKKKAQEARIRVKSGEDASDIVAEELAVKYHPIAYSATRGAASGATFGLTELAIKSQAKRDKERAKNEQYYQEHKSKGAELAGELVGSLASFGGAAKGASGATRAGLKTVAGEKAVAKLAGTKLMQNSAKKALTRGVEKEMLGAGESLGREILEEVAKSKSRKVLSNLGENLLVNSTAGTLYDFNRATSQYEIGSPEWKREMRIGALFNAGITGGGVALSHLGNKSALADAVETVGRRGAYRKALNSINLADAKGAKEGAMSLADDIARMKSSYTGDARNVLADAPDIMPKGGLGSRRSYAVPTVEDAVKSKRRTRLTLGIGGIDVRKPENLSAQEIQNLKSLRESIHNTIADIEGTALKQTDESKILRRQAKKIDEVLAKAEGTAGKTEAKQVSIQDLIDEHSAGTLGSGGKQAKAGVQEVSEVPKEISGKWATELEEANEQLKAMRDKAPKGSAERKRLDEQIKANEEGIKSLKKEASAKGETQASFNDSINSAESVEDSAGVAGKGAKTKATPPKTAKQMAEAEAKERSMLDGVQRRREEVMDAQIREQTKGEYGYRRGEHTSTANVSMAQARRNEEQQKAVLKKLKDKDVKSLFTDDTQPFGVFKTANRAELDRVSREAATRVREDPYAVMKRLRELDERLVAEADKSALTSAEHITMDDIADITALENMFEEAGVQIPREYEEAFSHIMEWQGTEAGQMLKMRDLLLRETSKSYRKKLISRDVDKYLRKVLNMDDVSIADLKRSLDANNGEGYFDKMVEELSKFKGAENEAAFRKAYADFQAEIFMNTKPTVWDTVNLWRHTFMLSSPKTGANNIIGNIMQRTMYRISDEANILGESLAQRVNPEVKRTTAHLKSSDQRRLARMYTSGRLGEHNLKNAEYVRGFEDQVFADAINTAADADVGEMMASSKYMGDVIKGLKYKPETAGGKIKQGFVKGGRMGSEYVSIMLNEPDSWFVERNYRMALLKYLEANGVNSAETLATKEGQALLKDARAYAKDIALENTYKKANNVVSFLEGLRRKGHTKGSNAGYKAAAIMLDAELPYLKVPANLLVNNFKYSPLGLGKGAVDAFRGVVKGDPELLNIATRELSKGLTGTGMMALGYMMFCRDQTDDDSWGFVANAKDELKEYGMRDNSFKIGNHTFNISNMGIGSVQFLMGAALAEDLQEKGEVPPHQVVIDSLSKTVDTVADMSLMENAVSLLDAFGNGGDYKMSVSERLGNAGMEIAGDYAAQFIPNPLRGLAKGITSADLDTGVKKGDTTKVERAIERNKNNVIQGVPVLNEKILPHKVDTHGRLINERETATDKGLAVLNNMFNPLTATKVDIPEVDKEELKVKKENGESYKPYGFDRNRTYQAQVGTGKNKELIDLTGKEREQVARSAEYSGQDGIQNLVNKGVFGDRLGDRAQEILSQAPESDEEARALIFSTDEWKNADNARREQILDWYYGKGAHGKGVDRTRTAEAYINIAGNSEDDFRWQNDITSAYQDKYTENGLDELGITKGQWVDALEACKDTNHKWNEETQKNQDTINSAKKTKNGILSVEGLTPEQRIAIYNVIRGKRTGFGWNDWDGVTGYNINSGYSGYGGYGRRRYGGYRRRGHGGSGGTKASALPKSNYKASKQTYKDTASLLRTARRSNSARVANTVKVEPPTVKFKKYEV